VVVGIALKKLLDPVGGEQEADRMLFNTVIDTVHTLMKTQSLQSQADA
jgi:hypothetical protein